MSTREQELEAQLRAAQATIGALRVDLASTRAERDRAIRVVHHISCDACRARLAAAVARATPRT